MKKNIFYFLLLCLICATYLFHCSDMTNPYLDPSEARVNLKTLSLKNGDTVSIFSLDSIAVQVYLREHLKHFSLQIKNNRFWKDTTIEFSTFNKNQTSFSFSFHDTGWQYISLMFCRLNGDSSSQKIQIFATSPLKQNTLVLNAGDTATLSTIPVHEKNVFYVWDLHDGTPIKDFKPTIQHVFSAVPARSTGELYVIDQNNYRSPSSFFVVKSKSSDGSSKNITCENDSISKSGDTVYTSTPAIQFIGKISGITSPKFFKINDSLCDNNVKNSDGSYLFYDLFLNIDSLSPFQIIIQITDDLDKTFLDTMVIKYTQPGVYDQPVILIKNPSKDSSISNTQTTQIYGEITNGSKFQSGAIFTYIGSNLQNGFSRVNDAAFLANIKLDVGWNSIVFKLFPDSTGLGNSLANKEIFVKFDPQAKDTIPPKIVFIANGDTKLEDSITVRMPSMTINVWVMDNSPLKSVFVNDIPAHIKDSLPYTAILNLKHLDNKIVIKATDNYDSTSSYTFKSIKYNRLPIMAVEFSQKQFVADSVIKWKVLASDPDNDKLAISAFVNDTIIPMGLGGIISWRPSIKDTGWDTVRIEAYDGCDNVDTSFIINVSNVKNADVAVKWLTNAFDIADTLVVGVDTLKCELMKNPLSNLKPFNYKVEILNPFKVIHNSSDSSLIWIPGINDTGNRAIKFTITDTNNNTDAFTDYIKIIPIVAGIRFEKTTISGQESNSNTPINVLLSKKVNTPVTVNYGIDWTHTTASGSDFSNSSPGTITFNPGETIKSINLDIINDSDAETDEQIALRLSKPSSNAYRESQSSTIFTILDNDYVTYSFTSSQASGNELEAFKSIHVTLSAPCNSAITLACQVDTQYSTVSSSDYTFPSASQTITFAPGQTTATIQFQVANDGENEADEVIAFRLYSIANIVRPGATVLFKYTIAGTNETVQIYVDNSKFNETEYAHDINVQLRSSKMVNSPVSVYFAIDQDASTADSGSDYLILHSSPVVFQQNEWMQTIVVRILDDLIAEPEEKIVINFTKTSTGAVLPFSHIQTEIVIPKND